MALRCGVTAVGHRPQSLLCLILHEVRKEQGPGCHLWHYLASSFFMTDLSIKHSDCRFSLFPKLCNLGFFTPKVDFFIWGIAIGNDHQASKCRKKCFLSFSERVSVCAFPRRNPQTKPVNLTQRHTAGQGD